MGNGRRALLSNGLQMLPEKVSMTSRHYDDSKSILIRYNFKVNETEGAISEVHQEVKGKIANRPDWIRLKLT